VVSLIHPLYADKQTQKQIAIAYKANPLPSVQLQGFLEPKDYAKVLAAIKQAKFKKEIIADRYSREVAPVPAKVAELFCGMFEVVKKVTGKSIQGKAHIERYGHRDFTLRNDEEKPPGLLIYFDCTPDWHAAYGGATIISNEIGELARIQPQQNTLVLVDCSRAWPFVQYINHYAAKKQFVRIVIS
jgi:hypothetical protein